MTIAGDTQAGRDAGPGSGRAEPWAGSLERVDLGEVPYDEAIEAMSGWVAERRSGGAGDRLFLLSHPPVITYGHRTDPADLRLGQHDIPVLPVDRGGYATYHGPVRAAQPAIGRGPLPRDALRRGRMIRAAT